MGNWCLVLLWALGAGLLLFSVWAVVRGTAGAFGGHHHGAVHPPEHDGGQVPAAMIRLHVIRMLADDPIGRRGGVIVLHRDPVTGHRS